MLELSNIYLRMFYLSPFVYLIQVVSQLVLSAYGDGFDYFYQVNDDTIIVTPNWAPALISNLQSNPLIPNFGVTGPLDTNNDLIFTHAFVHRTHIEIFGHLFPPFFKV